MWNIHSITVQSKKTKPNKLLIMKMRDELQKPAERNSNPT